MIGAYTVASHSFDIWLALGFGIVGYVFKKLDYPLAPFVLAMVLGDKAEDAFRQAMLTSDGSASIFWSNGLVSTMMGLGILLLCLPLISFALRKTGLSFRKKVLPPRRSGFSVSKFPEMHSRPYHAESVEKAADALGDE